MRTYSLAAPPNIRDEAVSHGASRAHMAKALFCAAIFVALAFPNLVEGQTVVSNLDEGELTTAIQAGGTVTFATNGTIVLTAAITIYNDVVLDGTGHSVTISGGGVARIFELPGGFHLTLRNLTLSNGSASGCGGAIFSQGFLNVEGCLFASNTVAYPVNFGYGALTGGGAIYSAGVLTVSNSTFLGNSATGGGSGPGIAKGGAIFNDGGSLQIFNAVLTGNTAIGLPEYWTSICHDCPPLGTGVSGGGSGGAIFSSGGTVNASNLVAFGNSVICPSPIYSPPIPCYASPAAGGAIGIDSGEALFAYCIFSNNLADIEPGLQYTALSAGGSVYNAGSVVLSNCAILDSLADNGFSAGATGGGVYNSGAMLFYNTTISGNSVGSLTLPGLGGGIYIAGSAQVVGCTISNNMADGGSGGAIANIGISSISNTMLIGSAVTGTNSLGIGIYNTGVFKCDSNSFLTGIPTEDSGASFAWELNGVSLQGAVSDALNLGLLQFATNATYSLLVSNSSATATNYTEVVCQPATNAPTFVLQPAGELTNVGSTVELQAAAIGFPAPSYQWQFNGANLAGATTSALTLGAVTANQAGSYSVIASNVYGAVTSQSAALVLEETNLGGGIAEIQPQNQVVLAGTNVVFSATSPPAGVTFQWLKNGTPLGGQTNSSLTLTNVGANDDGAYCLGLSTPGGTVSSGSAFLSVITGPPIIVAQPQNASVANGSAAILSVGVAGGGVANPPVVNSGKLQLWLKADAGAAVAANGHVIRWQDQSGNINDAIQLDTNAQPSIAYPALLGGLPAVRFSGAQNLPFGEYLAGSGTVGVPGDLTTFMVYDVSTSTIPDQVAFYIGVPGTPNSGLGDELASGGLAFISRGQSFDSDYLVPTNAYRVWSDRISSDQTYLEFFDDTLDTSSNFTLLFGPQAAPPGPGYYVGGVDPTLANVGAGYNFAGDIAELMVYDGALSDADRLAVVNYLKRKYYQINPPGVTYQWTCNGTNVGGATNATLVFPEGQPAQTGVYNVIVSNQLGFVVSSNATVSISPSSRVVSDLDEGSLELAMEEGGQITFTTSGTILFANTVTVTSDAIIDGTGQSITLSGGGATRLFDVPVGFTLTLRNLTLANAIGGAINTKGSLTIENCVITNNSGQAGGAIYNAGDLTLSDSVFANNSVLNQNPACGGAIYNFEGTVTLNGVLFSNNIVAGSAPTQSIPFLQYPSPGGNGCGGALYSYGGTVFAVGLDAVRNTATALPGGALEPGSMGTGTAGAAMGGAICIAGGDAMFTGCIFTGNGADGGSNDSGSAGLGEGGGLFTSGETLLERCMFFGNRALGGGVNGAGSSGGGSGGGVFNSGIITIHESLVSGNTAQGGGGTFNDFVPPSVSPGQGGGIFNSGVALFSSSGLSGNTSAGGQGEYQIGAIGPVYTNYSSGWGGAIANVGVIQLQTTTLSNNVSTGVGDYGEAIYNTGAFMSDTNSIVVANAAGTTPLSYAWELDGTNIGGATAATFNLGNIEFNDSETYSLVISNSGGLVTNDEILNLPVTNEPAIVLQPFGEVTNLGATVEFSAAATGFPAPTYQWIFDGTNVAGATDSVLILSNVLQNFSGTYTVVATNLLGSTNSQPAVLTVEGTVLLTGLDMGSAGFSISGEGMAGMDFVIEVSTNLIDWQPLQTNPSPWTFTDTNAVANPSRFYRAVLAQ
jgi:hypothetical protein